VEDFPGFDERFIDRAIEMLDAMLNASVYGDGLILEDWQRRALKEYVKRRLRTILARIDGGDRLREP
jgi:hypothetical protein